MAQTPIPINGTPQADGQELPLDGNFVEQAEYIDEDTFLQLSAQHPDEESIVRRLSVGGAKLLVGPRGCGKTTLMLKAYFSLLRAPNPTTLPVYVNFKLSLKLEPLYTQTPNATFWFKQWLAIKVLEGLLKTIELAKLSVPTGLPTSGELERAIHSLESGSTTLGDSSSAYTMEGASNAIAKVLSENGLVRCVLLMDDAAHAFSPRQQEDFFEFFRQIKSREISPKAAIYPGITTLHAAFHVGHDAEQIDVWVRPDRPGYVEFMTSLATKRFNGTLPAALAETPDAIEFLAYSAFGVPRSFLNMLRAIYHEIEGGNGAVTTLDRRKLLDIAKQSRALSHNVYDSLVVKIPSYKSFVITGTDIYQKILGNIKRFNKDKPETNQALEFGLKKPVPLEIEKVLSFLQYAGLVMATGENSRGIKGNFELYLAHYGDLVSENAIIGRKTKSVGAFVTAFRSQTHQAWPRISPETLAQVEQYPSLFRLSLPNCQSCGAERPSENARFCQNCGAQLKSSSLYEELVGKDIGVLPISKKLVARIKSESSIKIVKDILMDGDKSKLRSVSYIGPVRSTQIVTYAEEYLA